MKSLAGANPESKPDYRSQALTDLNKLEQKVVLLNEMLDNADTERGERPVAGDVYEVKLLHHGPSQKSLNPTSTSTASSFNTFQCTSQIAEMDI
jgi:hypothetical protein